MSDPADPEHGVPADDVSPGGSDAPPREGRPHRARRAVAVVAGVTAVGLVVTGGVLWQQSLLPDTYSVMSMGELDLGGGPLPAGAGASADGTADQVADHAADHAAVHAGGAAGAVSVADLRGPDGPPDVQVTLTARAEGIRLDGLDRTVDGFTLNHASPGPQITVDQGQLLEVTVVNESVPDGIAMHWHGVDVPNGEDGVAGVTQDAVAVGEQHVYRFVAEDAGTYWYHSHQVADVQVARGLFGTLVVRPVAGAEAPDAPEVEADTVAAVHTYNGSRTVNGVAGTARFAARPGDDVRVRVVNTNNGPLRTWVTGSPYTVLAVDGTDLNGPDPVTGQTIVIAGGGRADLLVTVPPEGSVAVSLGGGTVLAVGPDGADATAGPDPGNDLDLLTYGTPADVGLDADAADRSFEYRVGRRIGFLDGRPGFWWTINGGLYPDVPAYLVEEGDVVRMTITNTSGEVHPMHLHGHHALVVSRDGQPATGSPWWVDSLDVLDGESYVIAFTADNPGIWMDHCHNLVHASQGLVTHLMYAGVTTPFLVGGTHGNEPE